MKAIKDVILDGLETHVSNRIKNTLNLNTWKRQNKDLGKEIEKNQKFHNIHRRQRCFVLANGPSLRDVDFSMLKGETLFAMNLGINSLMHTGIHIDYYFVLDGVFFYDNRFTHDRAKTKMLLDNLVSMGGVECFFPIESRDFIRGNRYDNKLHVNYCAPIRLSLEKLSTSVFNPCSLTGFRYMSYSVAIDAVMAAIYMGFSEIYLLGCDASVIKSRIDTFMGSTHIDGAHFYEKEGIDDAFVSGIKNRGILQELRTEYYSFLNWNYIRLYCAKHGIKLINLSSETLLDFIPRMRLDQIV